MIVRTHIDPNFILTKSDENLYIIQVQTGRMYEAAIDLDTSPYTYIESDEPIEPIEE